MRCVLWTLTTDSLGEKVAEPFGAGVQVDGKPDQILADTNILWDSWKFSLCDDACTMHRHLVNKTVRNGAPARVTRGGLALPSVSVVAPRAGSTAPLLPFVVATRYPQGRAILLTSMGRTQIDGWSEPAAHVNLTIPGVDHPLEAAAPVVGILGRFASVTLAFEASAHDVGSEVAPQWRTGGGINITARDMLQNDSAPGVQLAPPDAQWLDARTLRLDGAALQKVGTAGRSGRPDDVSSPGVVLRLG